MSRKLFPRSELESSPLSYFSRFHLGNSAPIRKAPLTWRVWQQVDVRIIVEIYFSWPTITFCYNTRDCEVRVSGYFCAVNGDDSSTHVRVTTRTHIHTYIYIQRHIHIIHVPVILSSKTTKKSSSLLSSYFKCSILLFHLHFIILRSDWENFGWIIQSYAPINKLTVKMVACLPFVHFGTSRSVVLFNYVCLWWMKAVVFFIKLISNRRLILP